MTRTEKFKKTILILYLAAVHLLAGFFIFERVRTFYDTARETENAEVKEVLPLPSPVEIPYDANNFAPELTNTNQPQNNANQIPSNSNQTGANTNAQPVIVVPEAAGKLMIPVAGIKRENLLDTYSDARSEDRVHNAIDIPAAQGTPVVAVADGEIARFFDSELGGITIYQFSKDKKFVYYYAHLQSRAPNLQEKAFVRQGTVIGYVGDTGNAGAGNFHLHFSISIPAAPDRYWEGTNINPFPLLKDGIEARTQ